MAIQAPQNFANHTRWDPLFHFFLIPVFVINLIGWAVALISHPNIHMGWMVIVAIALLVLAFKVRLYALKVQTRLIRLEERLRLANLLQEPWRARISELTESQLVALRFASDAEVAALAQHTLTNGLTSVQIKKSITNWRADWFRV